MRDTVLVFESAGFWQILLALAVVAAAWTLTSLGLRGTASRARRVVLLSLRALVLLTLALLFLGPALQQRKLSPLKSRLVVLVDASESMAIEEDARSRAERVMSWIREQTSALGRLQERFDIEAYAFADEVRPIAITDAGKRTNGRSTDLVRALASVRTASDPASQDLAGVVLISDGADTATLAAQPRDRPLPDNVQTLLESLRAPVNTFVVRGEKDYLDLAVTDVAYDNFAFIRNAVEIEVTVASVGLEDMSVPVTLEQGSRNLATRVVEVPAGGSGKASLRFVPDRVGKFVYRVQVPVVEGEIMQENNQRSFVTRIIRDKIRVLHVVGRPSWDQRFLRDVLKRNPNIDLVSFYILRTTLDAPGVGEDGLSLIPFPVHRLFGQELDTFDLVLFQNFDHGPYNVGLYTPQIAAYVRGGGAFCMVGGDLSFGAGGYGFTPLADILPVQLQAGDDWRVEEFRAVPHPEQINHPVLDVGDPGVWEKLPVLGSYNRVLQARPGATVLLVHPFEQVGGEQAPILALGEAERGRAAALLTDGSWRWSFVYAGRGGSTRPYHRLWNNLLRWLIRDPALNPVSIRSRKVRYTPGEPVRFRVRGRGTGRRARLTLHRTGDEDEQVVLRRSIELDGQGRAELEVPGLEAGAYRARVEMLDTPGMEPVEEALVVEGTTTERVRPAPRADILERMAEASGGRHGRAGQDTLGELATEDLDRYRVEATHTRPLLERWWLLTFVLALLGVEWWIRRRWGFS